MNAYDFVHLALHAMDGRIDGKTKLQKTVYFLGVMTGCLDDLGYRAHYYGPYSPDVAEAVDRLVALGFLDVRIAGAGGVDSRGFEVARYDFTLNVEGRRVAQMKAERFPEQWDKISGAAEKLKQAGHQDYVRLSFAAKTYYYYLFGEKKGKASTQQELSDLVDKFGWSVEPSEMSEAGKFLQKLNLVKLKGEK